MLFIWAYLKHIKTKFTQGNNSITDRLSSTTHTRVKPLSVLFSKLIQEPRSSGIELKGLRSCVVCKLMQRKC